MINTFKVIVSGFVFNAKSELFVIRRSMDEETFPGMLAIPGGTVEVEEMSGLQNDTIENELIREIKEETDIDVTVGKWLESSVIAKDSAKLYLFFECQTSGNEQPKVSDETPEVFWQLPSQISLDECTPSLKQYVAQAKESK